MEAFPDGGYFAGRNFVFDERVTVAGGSGRVLGTCCLCGCAHDTYEPRCRCSHCRMLVLVCPDCASHVSALLLAAVLVGPTAGYESTPYGMA